MAEAKTRGGPRRRLNAPRTKTEAIQMIAALEAKWDIVRMEEHLADMVRSQSERHNAREQQMVMKAVQLIMMSAGINRLVISEEDLAKLVSAPDPERLKIDTHEDNNSITFTITEA